MEQHINPDGSYGPLVPNSATISHLAWIGDSARIGERTRIGAWATVQTIRRTDGYWFALVPLESGDWRMTAGCRDFTPIEARDHWTRTRGGTLLGAETLAILDYFDACMALRIRGRTPA